MGGYKATFWMLYRGMHGFQNQKKDGSLS